MDNQDKRYIKTQDIDGNDIELYLKPPDYEISRLCDIEFRKAWTQSLEMGVKTHARLKEMFGQQGIWTLDDEKELNKLNVDMAVQSVVLEKLKREGDLKKAEEVAISIVEKRNRAFALSEIKNESHLYSCEGVANEIRMEAYVAYGTVYADDHSRRFFRDYIDFKDRRQEQAALDVYAAYLKIIIDENSDQVNQLPEQKFFVDQKNKDRAKKVSSLTKRTKKKKKKKKKASKGKV